MIRNILDIAWELLVRAELLYENKTRLSWDSITYLLHGFRPERCNQLADGKSAKVWYAERIITSSASSASPETPSR